jgi:putative ABC transport system permease protein
MNLAGVAMRNLTSRPLRSALTALGVGVALASFIALVSTVRGMTASWLRYLADRGTHLIGTRKGSVEFFSGSIDQAVVAEVRRAEGVVAVAGELVSLVSLDDRVLVAVGWDPSEYLWDKVPLAAGTMPGLDQRRGAALGEEVADLLGKKRGDTVRINGRDFVVTGIVRPLGPLSRNAVVMALPTMQDFLERPGKVNILELRVRDSDDAERLGALKKRLNERFPDLRFYETGELADQNYMGRFLHVFSSTVSWIALFMGALVTMNTLLMSVTERTYDLGVLAAIGWPPGRILAMILIEGVVLAGVGCAVGAAMGLGALRLLAELPILQGIMAPTVSGWVLLEAAGAALGVGLVGALYPAWRAVCLRPVDALRYE